MIDIDGSYGEGGGAILRQALGMAAYAKRTIRVRNIRAGRSKPGLAAQHLRAVEVAGAISGARVIGSGLGSTELSFLPGELRPGVFSLDVGTAGSTTLVLQTVLLPCLLGFGEFEFGFTGGTDVPWSPPADYMSRVTLAALGQFGAGELRVARRGYYPKGGGRVLVHVAAAAASAEVLEFTEPAEVKAIRGVSHASRHLSERRVAERQADAARQLLERLSCPVEIELEYSESASLGSGVTLWTEGDGGPPLGGSALGAAERSAEDVGRSAAAELVREIESGAAVDRHLADQLIPFLAARGGSLVTSEVTAHTQANMYIAEQLLGVEFEVEGSKITVEL